MNASEYWIDKLRLKHHPEGGYFKEVYRSDEDIVQSSLPERYSGNRSFATSIYFLLTGNEFSAFHRIKTDETWHFYQGESLELYVLSQNGSLEKHLMGPDYESGERFQLTIPRDQWFAARTTKEDNYTLVGCTVAPGFHFEDFELADRKMLLNEFPQHSSIINELTIS